MPSLDKYIINGELKDKNILKDIEKARDDYENGSIIEARDTLSKIVLAIDIFCEEN